MTSIIRALETKIRHTVVKKLRKLINTYLYRLPSFYKYVHQYNSAATSSRIHISEMSMHKHGRSKDGATEDRGKRKRSKQDDKKADTKKASTEQVDKAEWDRLVARERKLAKELADVIRQKSESNEGKRRQRQRIVAWAEQILQYDAEEQEYDKHERPPAKLKELIVRNVTNIKMEQNYVTDIGVYYKLSYLYNGKYVSLAVCRQGEGMSGCQVMLNTSPHHWGKSLSGETKYVDLPEEHWPALRAHHSYRIHGWEEPDYAINIAECSSESTIVERETSSSTADGWKT